MLIHHRNFIEESVAERTFVVQFLAIRSMLSSFLGISKLIIDIFVLARTKILNKISFLLNLVLKSKLTWRKYAKARQLNHYGPKASRPPHKLSSANTACHSFLLYSSLLPPACRQFFCSSRLWSHPFSFLGRDLRWIFYQMENGRIL